MKKNFTSLLGISLSLIACSSFGMQKRRPEEDANQQQIKKSKIDEFVQAENALALPDELILPIVKLAVEGENASNRVAFNALRLTCQGLKRLSEDNTVSTLPTVSQVDLDNEFIKAAKKGNLNLMRFLPVLIDSTDENGKTALMWVAEKNVFEADFLLNAGADSEKVSNLSNLNEDDKKELLCIAEKHLFEIVDFLIKSGASVDKVSHSGYTAISYAIAARNKKMVEKLYNAGASIEIEIKEESPLSRPFANKNVITSLGVACENGLYEMAKWMLEHKIIDFKEHINTLAVNGKTPLDIVNGLIEVCIEDFFNQSETDLNNLKDVLIKHGAKSNNNGNNQRGSLQPPPAPRKNKSQR